MDGVNMEQNKSVEIRAVDNGFFVMGARSLAEYPSAVRDDVLVFRTFAEMTQWLGEHFTHRQGHVKNDHEG
jgi:hypothetical protein